MIVVDASVVVELLVRGEQSGAVWRRLLLPGEQWHAPALLEVEVLHVLRRYRRLGEISPARADEAVADLQALPLRRYPHEPLLSRIWALRDSLTAYDAAYVALAEALDAPLITLDARLARSHGHAAVIEALPRA